MNLLNKTPSRATAERMKNIIDNLFTEIKYAHEQGMDLLWNPAEETSTQEILDEFGTEAGELFILNSELVKLIAVLDPDYEIKMPTKEYSILESGEVEIII